MTYVSKRETQALRGWWWEVKDRAGIYFDLINEKPSQQQLDVSVTMVRLHDAQRAVQNINCPIEAEKVRWHILESMRLLQISLADLLADYPAKSDKSHAAALEKYNDAHELLSMAGAL